MSDRLTSFLEALMLADEARAMQFISPEFTVHDGLDALRFVRHEIIEFKSRRKESDDKVLVEQAKTGDTTIDVVVTSNRGLLYAMSYHVDRHGMVSSNGSQIEIVGKIRYSQDGTQRAAAIRHPDDTIVAVTPMFAVKEFWTSIGEAAGQFSYVHFPSEIDVSQGLVEKVRITFKHRKSLTAALSMPGTSTFEQWQEKDLFPVIEGRTIVIPHGKSPVWSATAWLTTGRQLNLERPEPGFRWELSEDITMAVVTDALDNDWVAENGS